MWLRDVLPNSRVCRRLEIYGLVGSPRNSVHWGCTSFLAKKSFLRNLGSSHAAWSSVFIGPIWCRIGWIGYASARYQIGFWGVFAKLWLGLKPVCSVDFCLVASSTHRFPSCGVCDCHHSDSAFNTWGRSAAAKTNHKKGAVRSWTTDRKSRSFEGVGNCCDGLEFKSFSEQNAYSLPKFPGPLLPSQCFDTVASGAIAR